MHPQMPKRGSKTPFASEDAHSSVKKVGMNLRKAVLSFYPCSFPSVSHFPDLVVAPPRYEIRPTFGRI